MKTSTLLAILSLAALTCCHKQPQPEAAKPAPPKEVTAPVSTPKPAATPAPATPSAPKPAPTPAPAPAPAPATK